MKKRRLAIFDVDGTIFRSSLFIELVERLIEEKHLPRKMQGVYAAQKERWMNREGEYDAYVSAMVRASQMYFSDIEIAHMKTAARHVVQAQWKQVYRYTRDLIRDIKEKQYFMLAVSHSPKVVLDYFCPRLGFDKWYGILYATDQQNRLTGEVVDEDVILNKATILKRAVKNQNLTLDRSVGVGDSESDVPFLSLVAKPICFNPSSGLYRHAKKKKWPVVVERKDVIYEL